MARTVDEVMNRELFTVRPQDEAGRTRSYLLSLAITSAPVVDHDGRPLGVVSLRDLDGGRDDDLVRDRMSAPCVSIASGGTIESAARRLAETALHHAPVIDRDGRAIGFVSSVDLLRALLGMPARHPDAFPHYDRRLGVTWSDDLQLDAGNASRAPSVAGLVALVHGGPGLPERVVWLESVPDVRRRLRELVERAGAESPQLAFWLERGALRFRHALVADAARRRQALDEAREELHQTH